MVGDPHSKEEISPVIQEGCAMLRNYPLILSAALGVALLFPAAGFAQHRGGGGGGGMRGGVGGGVRMGGAVSRPATSAAFRPAVAPARASIAPARAAVGPGSFATTPRISNALGVRTAAGTWHGTTWHNHNDFVHHNGRFFGSNFFGYFPGFFGYPWWAAWYPYYDLYYNTYPYYGYDPGYMSVPYYPGYPGYYGGDLGSTTPTTPTAPMPSTIDPNDASAHFELTLPDANADILVNGQRTSSRGAVRRYDSPALPSGDYSYSFRATWVNQEGQTISVERSVPAIPGTRLSLDFTKTPVLVSPIR
jgi:uncharacterized protein (TIGR03000 family)